jgi:hypothetical protein
MDKILVHTLQNHKNLFFTTSCAFVGDQEDTAPLVARSRVAKHLSVDLRSPCQVLISHEWWSPLQDILANQFVGTGKSALLPVSIVNVHGGNVWSSSWKNQSLLSFGDYLLDANERIGFSLNRYIVFPSN